MISQQIRAGHLQRLAYLYIRQSTLQQVVENRESQARQYALRERAVALGWSAEHIRVIDEDQGHSGASAADRIGFQRLVAEVGLGKVGLVMGLEVSRLARRSSDWHKLLEISALAHTLILDEDGLYDPATFNDRLLLGLKGAMSEAELHVLRARLQGGILNKARRGALKLHLPIGFRYREDDRIILDPNQQVQDTMRFVFRTFQQTCSASATVRSFRDEQVSFPRRVRSGPHQGELVWGDLRHDDVLRMLHNPCYAGAYVFGRTQTTKGLDGKVHIKNLPREEWQVEIREAHEGYISWHDYERNLEQLASNRRAYAPERLSPPREGPALLQGIVLCGVCGERMTVRYHQRAGKRIVPDYLCQRAGIARGEGPCQRIPGRDLDNATANLLFEVVTPEMAAKTLASQDELASRAQEAERLRQRNIERAEYEAELAQRRYLQVDPDNRLVADVLEAEWNEKLRQLQAARERAEKERKQAEAPVTSGERENLSKVINDFVRVWQDPQTTQQHRKRLARLVIADVTLKKIDHIQAQVRFKGGATRELNIPLPPPFREARLTSPDTIAEIDRLLDHHTDAEVAEQLNFAGYRTFEGLAFESERISALRRSHCLKSRLTRLREAGWLTPGEIAAQFDVTKQTVRRWYNDGLIRGLRYNDRNYCVHKLSDNPLPLRKPRQKS